MEFHATLRTNESSSYRQTRRGYDISSRHQGNVYSYIDYAFSRHTTFIRFLLPFFHCSTIGEARHALDYIGSYADIFAVDSKLHGCEL